MKIIVEGEKRIEWKSTDDAGNCMLARKFALLATDTWCDIRYKSSDNDRPLDEMTYDTLPAAQSFILIYAMVRQKYQLAGRLVERHF